MKKNRVIVISMTSFLLTMAVIAALLISAQKSHNVVDFPKTPSAPSITGVWHQVDGSSDENMIATINHGEIQVVLYLGHTSGVYWDGSFDFGKPNQNADFFDVVSETNHPNGIFSSKLPTKTFAYKDGVLSYEFKIVGTTRTIELKKEGN